jgi:hypothetical protein
MASRRPSPSHRPSIASPNSQPTVKSATSLQVAADAFRLGASTLAAAAGRLRPGDSEVHTARPADLERGHGPPHGSPRTDRTGDGPRSR